MCVEQDLLLMKLSFVFDVEMLHCIKPDNNGKLVNVLFKWGPNSKEPSFEGRASEPSLSVAPDHNEPNLLCKIADFFTV